MGVAKAPVLKAPTPKGSLANVPAAKAAVAKTPVAKAPIAKAPPAAVAHSWAEGEQAKCLSGEHEGQVGQVLSVDDEDITLMIGGDFVVLSASDLELAA